MLSVRCPLNILTRCFAILYVGAFILLITGRIGILGLCNFNYAYSVGSEGFFWTGCSILYLSMITLHCRGVFCTSICYLSVWSLGNKWKLLAARNVRVCTFLEYASDFILVITIVFLLSALTSIEFSVTSFLFHFFVIYNRLYCRML